MTALVLVLLICGGNFAMGFALAVYFGHGPSWSLPSPPQVRERLRSLLRMNGAGSRPH